MRLQDEYPFNRNDRACILRIGVIASVSGDGKHASVTVPGGTLTDVALMSGITAASVGARVALLLDRDSVIAIGLLA